MWGGQPRWNPRCHVGTHGHRTGCLFSIYFIYMEGGQYGGLWREGPLWLGSALPISTSPFVSSVEDHIIWKTQSDATQDICEGDSSPSSCGAAGPQPDWWSAEAGGSPPPALLSFHQTWDSQVRGRSHFCFPKQGVAK